MKYITVKLTEDQVRALIYASNAIQNSYNSIIRNFPDDNAEEKQKLAFQKRLQNKLINTLVQHQELN